jgi:hypothetical protein
LGLEGLQLLEHNLAIHQTRCSLLLPLAADGTGKQACPRARWLIRGDWPQKEAHTRLADFRVAQNREFFRYPLDRAIKLLLQLSVPPSDEDAKYFAEDILDRLAAKYGTDLDQDIVAVRIVQTKDRVRLEVTREEEVAGYLKDQLIKRTDLAFIMGETYDQTFFLPNSTVSENARRFVEDYDPFSIIMTTDLFHEEACKRIDREFNPIYKEGQQRPESDK